MVTHLSDEVRIVVNAAGRQKDLALCARSARSFHSSSSTALIALQGPAAEAVFAPFHPGHAPAFMQAAASVIGSFPRSKDGFEISIPSAQSAARASFFQTQR